MTRINYNPYLEQEEIIHYGKRYGYWWKRTKQYLKSSAYSEGCMIPFKYRLNTTQKEAIKLRKKWK